MKTLHPDLQKILPGYVEQVKTAYGEALVSLILYGSAAGAGYAPGRSDVNLMLVLTDTGVPSLKAYSPLYERWRKHHFNAPLFATREYLRSSVDVFPMEFLDIKEQHVVLFGEDVMDSLDINRSNLRYQCEEQVKGQMVRLRGALIEMEWQKERTEGLLVTALSSLLPVFRSILRLLRQECPRGGREITSRLCAALEIREDAFLEVGRIKAGEKSGTPTLDLAGDFLAAVEQLAARLDALKASGSL